MFVPIPEPLCGEQGLMPTFAIHTPPAAVDLDRFTVRKVRHRDSRLSHWIFAPSGEVHRPSLVVLTRYGTSTQETYAYSLRPPASSTSVDPHTV
jgi:hypothetical protein